MKKIIAQDQDIGICSNNASFVITLATVSLPARLTWLALLGAGCLYLYTHCAVTHPRAVIQEMFIQYIASEGLNMAKLERKPRRNIQYKDIGK